MNTSIKQFLLRNLFAIVVIVLIISSVGDYFLTVKDIEHQVENTLLSTNRLVKELARHTPNLPTTSAANYTAIISSKPHYISGEELLWDTQLQIWNAQHQVIFRSHKAPHLETNKLPSKGFSIIYFGKEKWRVYVTTDNLSGYTIVTMANVEIEKQVLNSILLDYWLIIIFIFPCLSLLIWITGTHFSKKINDVVKDMVSEPENITSNSLKAEKFPIELQPIVIALNHLVEKLENTLERERRFSGDAAHELRTPLAALKAQTQVAIQTKNHNDLVIALKKMLQSVDRCTHTVQQLLTLSRLNSETARHETFSLVSLDKIATETIAELFPIALDKNIEIELSLEPPEANYKIQGNPVAISVLIRNLIDNAIRYIPEKCFIHVTLVREDDKITLIVADNGPGIPEHLHNRLFERFFRVLGNKQPGSGLGLAIVAEIVHLHNADISVSKTNGDHGFRIAITFQAAK